ncbi:hypothetical protein K402DRAFT_393832 [Aulographum hederae CBS 113979]|uniref:Uncharacterized protein n=1 Tax=Aulographum hederae CBS 113979 TaxID=1176131 RepID=A0A6G1GZW4_9PEZI|nr:hypothetical protein K402DRAFT_393832 [Aulographum hederae CBS 113979]
MKVANECGSRWMCVGIETESAVFTRTRSNRTVVDELKTGRSTARCQVFTWRKNHGSLGGHEL